MATLSSRWTRCVLGYLVPPLAFFAAFGNSATYDPINQMCSRWNHQSVFKNNILFIDGGLETFSDPGAKGPYPLGYNKVLIEIPMTDSWDWKVNITEIAIAKSANPKTGTYPPNLSGGAMWGGLAADDQIYTYGGTYFQLNSTFGNVGADPATYTLWSYAKGANSWNQFDISAASPHRPSNGAYAEAPDQALGFYLGGQLDKSSQGSTSGLANSTVGLPGMIMVNMTAATPRARNISTSDAYPGGGVVGASLTYVSAIGEYGILVALGGAIKTGGDPVEQNGTLVPFDTVDLFDIASTYNNGDGTWYKQKTSGTPPPSRADFCTLEISAQDNSSHNVYVYGGHDPITGTLYDDVYALSLPSFTWVQIFKGDSPRWGHTCHLVGNRQMLTVGGNLSKNITQGCDWETKGVAIMDLSTKTWGSVYNAHSPPYDVTQDIVDQIGGSTRGGSTLKAPPGAGFSDPAIAALFARPRASPASKPSSSPKPAANAQKKSKPRPGAVAAAVLGVLVLVALLAGAALLLLHRKKQAQKRQHAALQMGAMERGGVGGGGGLGYSPHQDKAELAAAGLPAYSTTELPGDAAVQYHELAGSEKGAELHGDSLVAELQPPATPGSQERLMHSPAPPG